MTEPLSWVVSVPPATGMSPVVKGTVHEIGWPKALVAVMAIVWVPVVRPAPISCPMVIGLPSRVYAQPVAEPWLVILVLNVTGSEMLAPAAGTLDFSEMST